MKAILPILALALLAVRLAVAQLPLPQGNAAGNSVPPGAAGATDSMSMSGEALVRRVLANADAQPSISAKVRQKVDLMDNLMFGVGIYRQQGRGAGRLVRFELDLKDAQGKLSRVQQVCDGKTLWISQDIADLKSLNSVDVARVRAARPKTPAQPTGATWLALGGLPKLLANLDGSFRFGPVVESLVGKDLRVWTVEGTWKANKLVELLPDQKEAIEAGRDVDFTKLAPNQPDRVVLHVGCDDFFPYRIEYWRSPPAAEAKKSKGQGKLLVVMEFYEVQLGAPLDPREFAFDPGPSKPNDFTKAFLEKLGLEEAAPAGARTAAPPRR